MTIKTAGGKKTKYSMEVLANGDRRRTVQEPSGAKTVSVVRVDGITELTAARRHEDRGRVRARSALGRRGAGRGRQDRHDAGGKTHAHQAHGQRRAARPARPVLDHALRTTFDIDGETRRGRTPTATTVTQRSAEGRETAQTLDAKGRVVKQTLGTGVAPIDYTYDELGRPKTMKQGAEQTTFAYDAKHRLASSTDAAGNATSYVYDDADRVIEKRLPGNRIYRYTYDADGNVTTLTMPRGKVHAFGSTGDGRPKSYTPPGAARVRRARTRPSARSSRPSSRAARCEAMGYDAAGRLTSEDHVQSKRTFAYDGEQDRFKTVTRTLADGSGKQTIGYAYDGLMPASLEFTGAAAGSYDYTIGDRILPTSEKLTVGATSITRALEFDGDRLATKIGPFSIERTGPGGRGLEDHRRQARAGVRVRRQRPAGDAHADRGRHGALLPEAHVRQRRPRERRARSASTAARRHAGLRLRRHGPAADRQARRDRARGATPTTSTATGSATARPTTTATG